MLLIIGIIFVAGALILRYWLKRRNYNKRFKPIERQTYERNQLERVGLHLVGFIYYFLFIVGSVLILSHFFTSFK